jgi:hypothetical protein
MAKIITRPTQPRPVPVPGPTPSPPPSSPPSSQSDTGQIVLAGFLTAYLGAPLGCRDSSAYTLSKEYSSTTKVSVTDGSEFKITNLVQVMPKNKFMIGGSSMVTYTQSNSDQVSNGITLKRSTTLQLNTIPPGVVGNTIFIGLLRPTIELAGPPSAVRFKILKADAEFAVSAADIQSGRVFDPITSAAFLAQYSPLADPSGASLSGPRFKKKLHILLSAGEKTVFTFSKSGAATFSEQLTSSTSVQIVSSIGFTIGAFKETFSVGKTLSVQETSVQEATTTKTITLQTTLNRNELGVNEVWYDKVYKTFVIVDLGPPGPPVAQGRITDAQGSAIPSAVVKVTQNGVDYAAISDTSGNYRIAPAARVQLSPGAAQLSCGNVSKSVTLGSTPARADLSGVDPAAARSRTFDYLDL